MDGFINLYKPKAFTSHDALNIVRRNFRGTKIGHGGTLDPDATGVLPVCIGKATKLQDIVMGGDKAYEADVIFGLDSVSLDCGGEVTVTDHHFVLDTEKLKEVLRSFIGKQDQLPPMVSAIKRNGVPLYKLARRGETVDIDVRSIEIYRLELSEIHSDEEFPRIRIAVECSKGTYIRSLGRDIGLAMGTTAVIDNLKRTKSGMFSLENSVTLEELKELCDRRDYSFLLSMESAVRYLPSFTVTKGEEWLSILNGSSLKVSGLTEGDYAIYDLCGALMAIGSFREGELKPKKILWEPRKRKRAMDIVQKKENIAFDTKTVIAIGNFDGVHLGHRFLIEHCVREAEYRGLDSVVLSFFPHPQAFFAPDKHLYLQTREDKLATIDSLGVDHFAELPFDSVFASMSEETFIDTILVDMFHVDTVCVGSDFHYGKDGKGNAESLKELCRTRNITVNIFPKLSYGKDNISSSRVKKALSEGKITDAAHLLGRPYIIKGEVLHGKEMGRSLGFPTANLDFPEKIQLPRAGVYICTVRYYGKKHNGIACIGSRPTVEEGKAPNLEVHILDDAPDLYGKEIAVTLLIFLRAEQKFESVEDLKTAITTDVSKAKKFFEKRSGTSCN